MTKYRRKPVEFYAIQWKGDNLEEVRCFMGDETLEPNSKNQIPIQDWTDTDSNVEIGEYIIKEWEDAIHPDDWQYFITYSQEYFEECFEEVN
jgi:hypothetical protein